jgi:hypothetical protein
LFTISRTPGDYRIMKRNIGGNKRGIDVPVKRGILQHSGFDEFSSTDRFK